MRAEARTPQTGATSSAVLAMTDQTEPIPAAEGAERVSQTQRPAIDPAEDRVGVRLLIVGWCAWLLGAWGAALLINSTIPAARWMIFITTIGLMAVWPAYRLSLPRHWADIAGGPSLAVLLDYFSLMFVAQAVLWPLMITSEWTLRQTFYLDLAIGGWALLTALLIAWGVRGDRAAMRWLMMALCLLLLLGEPLAILLTGSGWRMHVSPIETLWALSAPSSQFAPDPWRLHAAAAGAAGLLGWLAHLLGRVIVRRAARSPGRPSAVLS
jgi:hypothetical protein